MEKLINCENKNIYAFYNFKYNPNERQINCGGLNDILYHDSIIYNLNEFDKNFSLKKFHFCAKVYSMCHEDVYPEFIIGKLVNLPKVDNLKQLIHYLETNQTFYVIQNGNITRVLDPRYLIDESLERRMNIKRSKLKDTLQKTTVVVETPVIEKKCHICWEIKEIVAIVDCGHYLFCAACLCKLDDNRCPVCKENIRKVIKIYE